MPRKIRDIAIALVGLLVLFIMLISISPQLRERAGVLNGGVATGQNLDASRSAVNSTVTSVSAVVSGYASDNPYQAGFVVAACVLFVLMLRT
jgi:hypothetical protein